MSFDANIIREKEELVIRKTPTDLAKSGMAVEISLSAWKAGGLRNRITKGTVRPMDEEIDLDEIVQVLRTRIEEHINAF